MVIDISFLFIQRISPTNSETSVLSSKLVKLNMDDEQDHVFDKTWVKELTITIICVVIVLTAFANGLVLWALKRFVALRKPANICLGGLAVADFCMVVPLTLKIVQIFTRKGEVCVAQGISELITISYTSLHLACIAIERFVSIKYCLRYDSIVTKPRIYLAIAVMWLFSIVASFVIPVAIHAGHFESLADGLLTLCSPKRNPPMSDLPKRVFYYAKFMLLFFFALPCFIIFASNTYIFVAASRQRRKIIMLQSSSKLRVIAKRLLGDLKAARSLFFIQALFVAAYFPYFTVTVHRIENSQQNERMLFRVSKGLSFITALTSCLNPLIYVSGNEQFRKAFKKLLGILKVGRSSGSSQ